MFDITFFQVDIKVSPGSHADEESGEVEFRINFCACCFTCMNF